MALPTSPSVVVRETDNSIYTPNVESSVVAVIGFADRGPINEATLVTSQNDLINKFGKPNSSIPGQGLEGALEILESTNQLYYVRAASGANSASSIVTLGVCPAVLVSSLPVTTATTSIIYSLTDNNGVVQVASELVSLASATGMTTADQILSNYFNPDLLGDQGLFYVQGSEEGWFEGYRFEFLGKYSDEHMKKKIFASDQFIEFCVQKVRIGFWFLG